MGKYDGELLMRPYLERAERGDLQSQLELIDLCKTLDQPKAWFYWATRAAQSGTPEGVAELAICYLQGAGTSKDIPKAMELIQPLMDQNLPAIWNVLGMRYELEKDYAMASEYYEKAMNNGSRNGKFNYARMIHYGFGCPREPMRALPYMRELAEEGHAAAAMEAYVICSDLFQEGLPVDEKLADRYLRIAAEHGDGWAMLQLALRYDPQGGGPERNEALFMKWLERGAATGRMEALVSLAEVYLFGGRSFAEVAELLDKAVTKLDWFRTWEGGEAAIAGFEAVLCEAAKTEGFAPYLTPGLIQYAQEHALQEVTSRVSPPKKKGLFNRLFGG